MALARALAVEPKVLLLDEPFGALDARVRAELREWLRRLHDEVHVTTVFVTHDQEEAMEVADQIAVLNQGRIEQVGGPRDLYEQPATEFVMSFVGPVNRSASAGCGRTTSSVLLEPGDGAEEAMVERIVHLGFEVRVELVGADGEQLWAQVTRDRCEELELGRGQIVYVSRRATRLRGSCGSSPSPGSGSTRSASVVVSSTPRMLVRRSIQTSRRAAAPSRCSATSSGPRAAHGRDRPLDGADHVGDGHLGRRLREPVAALGAALARDDPAPAQLEQDVLEEVERDLLGRGEPLALERARSIGIELSCGELGGGAQGVVHLGRDPHGPILYVRATRQARRSDGRRDGDRCCRPMRAGDQDRLFAEHTSASRFSRNARSAAFISSASASV